MRRSCRATASSLGPWSLVALGIGSVIGSGIFTFTGTAAAGLKFDFQSVFKAPILDLMMHGRHAVGTIGRPGAGPAISLSFLLVAIACGFAALCYAELASMIPIAGSAYTYAYATLGEIFAWIIGWDLILEYAVSNMAVAVGFGAYFNDLLDNALRIPSADGAFAIRSSPKARPPARGSICRRSLLMMVLSWILVRGVKESADANNVMVAIKIVAILLFVFGAARAMNTANWHPFMPNGFSGVLTGGAIVFFTYIGFDSVSTAAEECRPPAARHAPGHPDHAGDLRDPLCRGGAGAHRHRPLGHAEQRRAGCECAQGAGVQPASSDRHGGSPAGHDLVAAGISVRPGAHLVRHVARPAAARCLFPRVHPKFKTPHVSTWVAGFVVGIPAGIWDIGTLGDLTNIGTLFAFMVVSAGVIILRRTQPDRPRSFRVPWVPLLPILSMLCCLVLMSRLPLETWIRFFVLAGDRTLDLLLLRPQAGGRVLEGCPAKSDPRSVASGSSSVDSHTWRLVPWVVPLPDSLPWMESVDAKIVRAQEHLSNLEVEAHQFLKSAVHKTLLKVDGPSAWIVYWIEDPFPPIRLSSLIGDSVFNMRSALDKNPRLRLRRAEDPSCGRVATRFRILRQKDRWESTWRKDLKGVPGRGASTCQGIAAGASDLTATR